MNCTWQNFTQKIDHFGDAPGTFPQRLCLYDKWWRPGGGAGRFRAAADAPGPILFYTGKTYKIGEVRLAAGTRSPAQIACDLLSLFAKSALKSAKMVQRL